MTKQKNHITDRIKDIVKYLGISYRKFEKSIEASNNSIQTAIKRKSDIKAKTLNKILQVYPEINPMWLLTGEGEMLRSGADERPASMVPAPEGKGIPFVDTTAIAGFGNHAFAIDQKDIKEYYHIPAWKNNRVDFIIEVYGDSMEPEIKAGDIVGATILRESNFIQYGKPHIIATREQGILVKRIFPGTTENTLLMRSDNKDYKDFEVPKDDITGIALIVGLIRRM